MTKLTTVSSSNGVDIQKLNTRFGTVEWFAVATESREVLGQSECPAMALTTALRLQK